MARFIVLLLIGLAARSAIAELPAAPTLAELQEIADGAHSPELTVPQLRIYPAIRKYHIRATMHRPEAEPAKLEMDAAEKWVDGRFIVSSFRFPWAEEMTHMIVTYDEEHGCYRKWVISSKSIDETMVGTRVGKARTISWVSLSDREEGNALIVSQETHTDTSTEWSEVHLDGENQVVARVKVRAVSAQEE